MDIQKVDMFMMSNNDKFPGDKLYFIRERLTNLDDNRWPILSSLQYKDPTIALILSLCLGGFGVDRFYIGDIGLGILKIVTCGGFGFWVMIDWFLITNATRSRNYEKLCSVL